MKLLFFDILTLPLRGLNCVLGGLFSAILYAFEYLLDENMLLRMFWSLPLAIRLSWPLLGVLNVLTSSETVEMPRAAPLSVDGETFLFVKFVVLVL